MARIGNNPGDPGDVVAVEDIPDQFVIRLDWRTSAVTQNDRVALERKFNRKIQSGSSKFEQCDTLLVLTAHFEIAAKVICPNSYI